MILVLSTFDLDELVFGALQAGASGFLLKDCPPQEFLDAIRLVASIGSVLAPRLTGRLIQHFVTATRATRREEPSWLSLLTPREVEVVAAIGAGLSNTEIAETLHMSHGTAKTHVGRLLAILQGTRSRTTRDRRIRGRSRQVVVASHGKEKGPGLHRSGAHPTKPYVTKTRRVFSLKVRPKLFLSRLDAKLRAAVEEQPANDHTTRSDVIREAFHRYLDFA